MIPRVVAVGPVPADDPAVLEAAGILRAGGVVAFPTETVYGLGADARSESAVERVFVAKGRPADNPLIVHVASADDLASAASFVPDEALRLAAAFWPGPLTLVLPAREELRRAACRGLPTVAVRVPDHPVALALLRACGFPLAAPSANLSGRPSPTRAEDVALDLAGRIPLVLDGGPCRVGLESTVLDLTGATPLILRPGAVSAAEIERVLGVRPAHGEGEALARSPGTRYRHYSPATRLLLLGPRVSDEAALRLVARLGRAGYLGDRRGLLAAPGVVAAHAGAGTAERARLLYARLRDLDAAGLDAIVADEPAGDDGATPALRDRLRRAATEVIDDDDAANRAVSDPRRSR